MASIIMTTAECKLQGIFIHPSHQMTPETDADIADMGIMSTLVLGDEDDGPDSPASFASSLWSRHTSSRSSASSDYFGSVVADEDAPLKDETHLMTAFTSPPLASPQAMSRPLFPSSRLSQSFSAAAGESAPMIAGESAPMIASCSGGANMLRSVSLPVETFKELETRRRKLKAVSAAVADQLVGTSTGVSTGMSRSKTTMSKTSAAKTSPFGQDWGSALPPRVQESEPLVPFPYNLVTPKSPPRLMRSHSTSDVIFNSPASSRQAKASASPGSLTTSSPPSPTSASSFSSSCDSTPSAAAPLPIAMSRHRRPTWISPMTPIVGSPPIHDHDEAASPQHLHAGGPGPGSTLGSRPGMPVRVASYYQ